MKNMTVRLKLAVGSIAVILVANALLSLGAVMYLEHVWFNEVQARVGMDLRSARAAYDGHVQAISRFLQGAALDGALTEAVIHRQTQRLPQLLEPLARAGGMDFLTLLDTQGKVLQRTHPSAPRGDDLRGNPLVAQALAQGTLATGTLILSPQSLAAEGPSLVQRAQLDLVATPAAKPAADTTRSAGMTLAAVVPVHDADGKLVAFLYAGDLLSRRNELVDRIRDEVDPRGEKSDDPPGTVTIFQDDLRIATNVPGHDGQRALGTRLSSEVYDKVIERGESWSRRAQVVDRWYITAYEPLRDPTGKVVGALYVGLPEAPFAHRRNVITGVVVTMVLGASLASLLLLSLLTTLVLRPVGRIVRMAQRVIRGDMTARVGIRPPGEMGVLCQAIDAMADAVARREHEVKSLTRQQIGRAEKLASIGRLAAGVAHEINNPLTGVLTFAHLLRDKPNMDEQDKQDLSLIIHETTRAAEIVRGLLDFARERAARKDPLDINDAIHRTVRLIQNQKKFDRITINENLGEDLPDVLGDTNQLQQVLLNLSLNACEAMPEGGSITITSFARDDQIFVRLADTGCGIRPELLDKIFEPFFTTKPVGKGTGLGLSVSYGIIDQHGGDLEVESQVGRGTVFTISLPTREVSEAKAAQEKTVTNQA